MAPNVSKGKGVASSSHGSKRARRTSEEDHKDVRMAPRLLRHYGLHWIMKQEADYRPAYDPKGIDVTKTKEPEGINDPVLFVNKRNAQSDNIIGLGFEEPLDDDVATEDEMARVDSDIESSDDNEEDSEMREATLAPTDDEE
ncbi:hypothetical protein HAX54_027032 [Datura stramonium]|uniref:Uncharacterized protein n=1 Tax=Datura stramonium TaxID=4076 RepID=A0ABS8V503_DATST|nr:hypothetical protein [Datura stramonium]